VPDDVNAVFIFNPFGGDIPQAVIAQVNSPLTFGLLKEGS